MGEGGAAELWIPADRVQGTAEFRGGSFLSCVSAGIRHGLFYP